MAAIVRKLTEASVWLNGTGYVGVASEVTLSEVKAVTKEHAPTCMKGKIQLPIGIELTPTTIKGDFDPAFYAAAADIYHVHVLQIRSNLTTHDEAGRAMEQTVVVTLRGYSVGPKFDSAKNGDVTGLEYGFNPTAMRVEVDGVPITDVSLNTNKHEVLGKNLNATGNSNLGR